MDISKKQHLPPKMFGEDQADGAFEEDKDKDKELDEMDNEAHDPTEKGEDDINDEEEQDPDSDKDKA